MSNTFKIYTLAILSFCVGTSENIVAGILDKFAASLHISVVMAGQLITVFSLAYAIGVPIVISLTTGVERKKLILYGIIFFVIGNFLAYLLPNYIVIIISRIITGVSAGVTVVSALAIAAKLSKPGKEGTSIATVLMGFTASLIFGVPLGRFMSSIYGWRIVFLGISLAGLLALLIIAFIIPKIDADKPVSILEQLTFLKSPRILIALSISFFWIISYSIFFSYVSPFLLMVADISEKTIGSVLFLLGIASLLGSRIGGTSADKWGIKNVLLGGFILCFITLTLLGLFSKIAIMVILLLVTWSIGVWVVSAPQQLYLITLAPESSSVMLSLNNSVIQMAMAAGAILGGISVNRISLSSVTWSGAIGSLLAIWMVYLSCRVSSSRDVL